MKHTKIFFILACCSFSCSKPSFVTHEETLSRSKPSPAENVNSQPKTPEKTSLEVTPDPQQPTQKSIDSTTEVTQPPAAVIENKAVFAVRNISCALCHSNIQSNVITDFMAGSDQRSQAQSLANAFYLADHGTKPLITGDFFVPKSESQGLANDVVNGLSNCNKVDANSGIYFNNAATFSKVDLFSSLKKCLEPKVIWGANSNKVVERNSISIKPPTDLSQIASIVDGALLADRGFAGVDSASFSGLVGTKQSGYAASGSVTCEGAMYFETPILFRDLTITTTTGCRVYSTKSIFSFGKLEVLGPSSKANLQLLSTIYVGFDIQTSTAKSRVLHSAISRQVFSRGSSSQVALLFEADALQVGADKVTPTGTHNYQHIAVSAPLVYSRSTGSFSGVIVAEQFLGKIGSLSFTFDPVFSGTADGPKFFPEIKEPMTTID